MASSTNLAICGAAGRMGRTLLDLALRDNTFSIAGLVESAKSQWIGKEISGVKVSGKLSDVLKSTDVVIDFTSPAAALANAQTAADAKKALVVGTTGFDAPGQAALQVLGKKIPLVVSPNMSLGANLLFELAESLAKALPGFDVEITEMHHNQKKDAPSGTAQRLADAVAKGRGASQFVYGRQGQTGQRTTKEIGVHALRGGDVVGDHTVFYIGTGERLELTHRATSREAFAAGALAAALWVVKQPAGLYDMRDVLGLKTRK